MENIYIKQTETVNGLKAAVSFAVSAVDKTLSLTESGVFSTAHLATDRAETLQNDSLRLVQEAEKRFSSAVMRLYRLAGKCEALYGEALASRNESAADSAEKQAQKLYACVNICLNVRENAFCAYLTAIEKAFSVQNGYTELNRRALRVSGGAFIGSLNNLLSQLGEILK